MSSSESVPSLPPSVEAPVEIMQQVLESGLACICVKDEKGRFIYANRDDANLYEKEPKDVIGKTVEPFVGKETFEMWYAHDLKVMAEGKPVYLEPTIRTDVTGKSRWLEAIKIPLFNPKLNRCDRLLVIHRDVTELKNAELEKQQLTNQLQKAQRLEAMGTLAGGVAHEFNNLLTPLLFQIEMIEERYANDSKMQELLAPARLAMDQAIQICQRVLSLSRNAPTRIEWIELNKVVVEVCEFVRRTYNHRIHFEFELDPELRKYPSSRPNLSQTLINLCNNARDTLEEKLKNPPESWSPVIHVKTGYKLTRSPLKPESPLAVYQYFSISDNGMGMTPDLVDKLYHPFFTTKQTGYGNGLGLYVTWSLIHSLQGWIEVESEPGQGSTFRVFFPELQAEHEGEAPTKAIPDASFNSTPSARRILLVDDNDLVSRSLSEYLHPHGFDIEVAEDGAVAWEKIKDRMDRYDLIITDQNMPGLSGLEFVRQIREANFKGPVLVLSGFLSSHDEADFRNAGATRILIKPASPASLIETLRDMLKPL